MREVLGLVIFVLALLVAITLHEGGHFATARAFGMKATQFFVGFGPTVWSFHRGETEYGIKAIPAGGFCKIIGMTPSEPTDPADASRLFYRQPGWQRVIVLAAGSVMHFLIAIVLIFAVLVGFGRSNPDTTRVTVSDCIPTSASATACSAGNPVGVARQAGMRTGDVIVAVGTTTTPTWGAAVSAVRADLGRPVTVTVLRAGHRLTLGPITPVPVSRYVVRPDGSLDPTHTVTVGAIGVAQDPALQTSNPVAAVGQTFSVVGGMFREVGTTLVHRLGKVVHVYDKNRPLDAPVGVVGAARAGGSVLADTSQPLSYDIANYLGLIASINLFIGVFNLLPLLPLDGGHIAAVAYEAVRNGVRRLRRMPRGEPVDVIRLAPLTYVVVVILVGFSLFVLGADIVNPVKLPQ